MADERTILQKARTLITEKRYSEARTVLELIPENTTAQEWIRKIDVATAPKEESKTSKQNRGFISGCLAMIVLFALVAVFAGAIGNTEAVADNSGLIAGIIVAIGVVVYLGGSR